MDYGIAPLPSEVDQLVCERPDTYGVIREYPSGNKYMYCYTALTTFTKGSLACLSFDGGATAGLNPLATKPATTNALLHKWGICCETVAAAGGIWVQIYGHCNFAEVEGGTTDIAIGDCLQATNATWYLITDGTTVTADTIAYAESVEAAAVAVQELLSTGGTGHCEANNSVFLLDRWACST